MRVANLGEARYLAVPARTRRRLLWGCAGLDGPRPSLAITSPERARHSNCQIQRLDEFGRLAYIAMQCIVALC